MRFRRCTAAKPHHRRSPLSTLGEQHLTPPYGAYAVPVLAAMMNYRSLIACGHLNCGGSNSIR